MVASKECEAEASSCGLYLLPTAEDMNRETAVWSSGFCAPRTTTFSLQLFYYNGKACAFQSKESWVGVPVYYSTYIMLSRAYQSIHPALGESPSSGRWQMRVSVKVEQKMSGALREHTQSSEQLYSHAIKYRSVGHAVSDA